MKNLLLLLLLLLLAAPLVFSAEPNDEREAVRRAVLDYVEAIYEVKPALIERSVHTGMAKTGYFFRKEDNAYRSANMSYEQLVELAGRYNKDGRVPKDAVKEVVVYEALDQTASAKLVASWGIDYMHLAKIDGKWKIVNVLWQSHPR